MRWGKRTADGRPYLLDGHLIDTGVVAEVLWDRYFEPHTRRWFLDRLGPDARRRFALLAASHDCGKLAPTFQCRLLDRDRPSWAPDLPESERASWPDLGDVRVLNRRQRWFLGHATESGRTLERAGAAPWWSRVVEGHHGRFPPVFEDEPARTLAMAQRAIDSSHWPAEQENALGRIVAVFSAGDDLGGLDTDDLEAVAAVHAVGWVSVADWLASADDSVESGAAVQALIDDDLAAFVEVRRAYFETEVERMLGSYDGPAGEFADVFGFGADRPVQQFVAVDDCPEFCALAVPMGAGKTEAALERHRRLGSQSLYFALPTMATADAMFERVRRFYERSETTTGALLHGRASVNDFYVGAAESDFDHSGDRATGLVAGQWLRGRHRGLLAPVGVGTVDQVLAAVLRARYATVRLAAISNTHIIFDEVHSYDPYQQQMFCVVLRWLGIFRAPVTLLSATLPSELAARYSSSYLAGWRQDAEVRQMPWEPLAYPGAVSASGGGLAEVAAIDPADERVVGLEFSQPSRGVVPAIVAEVRRLREEAPNAVIGVVVNRVSHCVEVASELADLRPLVLHARMPTALRAERQAELVAAVGPGSTADGQLVVGTQVLEQSLDIDLDVLVTEFAPAPDLIQRTGRLWRHSTCVDGAWHHPATRPRDQVGGGPLVSVFAPVDFDESSTLPYMPGVLAQSWSAGFASGAVTSMAVPDDLQQIVDASHVTFDSADMDDSAIAELLASVRAKRSAALDRTLPLDWLMDDLGLEMLVDVTAGGGDAEDERATRWQDQPSETIALVSTLSRWGLSTDDLTLAPVDRTRAIIGASVSLSGGALRRVEPELGELVDLMERPPRWPLGRYLDVDKSAVARLDPVLGLVLEPQSRSDGG